MLIDEIVTAALVLLVSVTLFAVLVVPKAWFPKLREAAESVNWATPVPVRLTFCGLLPAVSVRMRVAVSAPRTEGVYVTLTVQEECAAMLAPQVVADCAKSPGVGAIAILANDSATLLLFVTVTVFAALVLTIP
jgi:hypothetical protein